MSTSFKDDNQREWRIHLTLGKVKEINDKIGHDLLAPWDGEAIDAVTKDMFRFAEILALVVEFDKPEDGPALAEGLRGEGLDRAVLAFWKDLSHFFVGAQRRAFQVLIAKAFEAWDAIWIEGAEIASKTSIETIRSMMNTANAPRAMPTIPAISGN